MISGEATIRIGHGEVFLKRANLEFYQMHRRYQWWSLLLLIMNVIHTRSNWLYWKVQEKFQPVSRFWKTTACSYVTLFKVSNKNTRKRCLLMSKITLKTSEQRHLTTSYLREVIGQNHVLDSFSKNIYQFEIKSLLSVLLASWFMKIFDSWKFELPAFFYFWKNSPKNGQIFQLFTKGLLFQCHKVRHPNFL